MSAAAPVPDAKVWNEYGLQESETATYTDPANKTFSVTAYRFSDSTGSFAAWIASRPADAHKFETDGLGAETRAVPKPPSTLRSEICC